MTNARVKFIGIDPGRSKCGVAAIYDDGARAFVEVVPTGELEQRIDAEVRGGRVAAFCVGHATTSLPVLDMCRRRWPEIALHVVDETNTTYDARGLYYEDHPPRGWLRFIPRGLLVPSAPLDGYAALLIVRRCFAARNTARVPMDQSLP